MRWYPSSAGGRTVARGPGAWVRAHGSGRVGQGRGSGPWVRAALASPRRLGRVSSRFPSSVRLRRDRGTDRSAPVFRSRSVPRPRSACAAGPRHSAVRRTRRAVRRSRAADRLSPRRRLRTQPVRELRARPGLPSPPVVPRQSVWPVRRRPAVPWEPPPASAPGRQGLGWWARPEPWVLQPRGARVRSAVPDRTARQAVRG